MTSYYHLTPAAAFQRIRTQTAYDGPWHILVARRGHDPLLLETWPTTRDVLQRAASLASEAQEDIIYIVIRPDDTSTYILFQGLRPHV